ncbi:MAG: hypothetical protein II669_03250 [Elusimicrobia bacterium]|nr:hypothetical protein [Elusimicrobiota bacterium]
MKIRQFFLITSYLIKYGLKIIYFLHRASKAKPNDDKIGQNADASTAKSAVKGDASTYNSDKALPL